ncbi:MAG: hypothetical protein K2L96_06200 [Muribaculaceae bacterium]|nr:hypothetical protein [Muribaculaceae bacterium]
MNTNANELKCVLSALGGWFWALYAPVFPYAGVCTFLVLLAGGTRMLRRRREGRPTGLTAKAAGRVVARLTRVNVALLAAHMVQSVILDGTDLLSVDLLKLTAAVVCFWQFLDILENESTGPWGSLAKELQKRLKGNQED